LPLSLFCREPLISYSFNITGKFGVGILTSIANGNGITSPNNDRNFDSDDFKNFYGRLNSSYRNQGIGIYGYRGKEVNASNIENKSFAHWT
jgi:hypothetical protein